jgi:hypothetical protein
MAKVIWTDPALADLAPIFDYLAGQLKSPEWAEALCLELLEATYIALGNFPIPERRSRNCAITVRESSTSTAIGSSTSAKTTLAM